jgi:tetratricopeptide (TPR) repeat protein
VPPIVPSAGSLPLKETAVAAYEIAPIGVPAGAIARSGFVAAPPIRCDRGGGPVRRGAGAPVMIPSLPAAPDRRIPEALALHRQGRRAEAAALYRQVLITAPHEAEALHLLGVVALQEHRFAEAERLLAQALTIAPDHAEALNNRGTALRALGRLDEALASYDKALAARPSSVAVLNNRGNVLARLGRLDEARADFDRALEIEPDSTEARNNRGNALRCRGRLEAALARCEEALFLSPGDAVALYRRSNALNDLGRLEEALASYDEALAIRPDFAEALTGRAHALCQLGRTEEALESCDRALAVKPDCAEALNNQAIARQQLGRLDAALAGFRAAIAVKPDFALAHWNEALCRLAAGDFTLGWQKYEWRWRCDFADNAKPVPATPRWLGKEPLSGKKIFLHAEQGFGDTLQFCRYAPAVAALGAQVTLGVPGPLKSLLETLPGVERVVSEYDPAGSFDFHCPLMSLPLAFGTRLESIPAAVPYLSDDRFRTAAWRRRLAGYPGVKVGLVWAGSGRLAAPEGRGLVAERRRSMCLDQLSRLGAVAGTTLVSLQKGQGASQARPAPPGLVIHDWTDELADFADTAALVAALDLVISVDTAVAHLAGALGRDVWVLLHDSPDWRWLREREDSPWYPTMRLFTQASRGDWAGLACRVTSELQNYAGNRPASKRTAAGCPPQPRAATGHRLPSPQLH